MLAVPADADPPNKLRSRFLGCTVAKDGCALIDRSNCSFRVWLTSGPEVKLPSKNNAPNSLLAGFVVMVADKLVGVIKDVMVPLAGIGGEKKSVAV